MTMGTSLPAKALGSRIFVFCRWQPNMELCPCCFLPLYSNMSNSFNRYSMPVTKSKNGLYEGHHLDQTNTARFLFGEDEPNAFPRRDTPDHNFPTLVRRDDQIVSLPYLF